MEPFALFQILQNLLNFNSPSTENGASPDPPPKTEKEETAQSAPAPQPPPTAILDFLDAHEKRAKRIKK